MDGELIMEDIKGHDEESCKPGTWQETLGKVLQPKRTVVGRITVAIHYDTFTELKDTVATPNYTHPDCI